MYENVSSSSDKQKVFDYLKEYSPDLSKFKYQPWDEETTKYVDSVIAFYTGRAPIGQGVAAPVMPAQKVASLDQVISSISAPSAPVANPQSPTTAPVNLDDILASTFN